MVRSQTPATERTLHVPEGNGHSISVMIVDDHDVVALGLRSLLEDVAGFTVLGAAHNVADAVAEVEQRTPDVVLMDYRLPDGTGAEATRAIRALPDAPSVVMVTSAVDRRVLGQSLDAGCSGFVSKNADRDDLVAAVRAAAAGDSYFTRDVLRHLVDLRRFDGAGDNELSDREVEVLQLVADGRSTEDIASELYLSPHTVKNHLRHLMEKLHVHTKLQAVVTALRAGIISIDD